MLKQQGGCDDGLMEFPVSCHFGVIGNRETNNKKWALTRIRYFF